MNFHQAVLQRSPFFHSPNRINSLDLLEPITRAAVCAIMTESAAAGMPLLLFESFRSQARQTALYKTGSTQLSLVGVHNYGMAADLVKDVGGEPSWKGSFAFLGVLARKHGLIWGGDWGNPGSHSDFVDACHVQRVRVSEQLALFNGSWWPEDGFTPWEGIPA